MPTYRLVLLLLLPCILVSCGSSPTSGDIIRATPTATHTPKVAPVKTSIKEASTSLRRSQDALRVAQTEARRATEQATKAKTMTITYKDLIAELEETNIDMATKLASWGRENAALEAARLATINTLSDELVKTDSGLRATNAALADSREEVDKLSQDLALSQNELETYRRRWEAAATAAHMVEVKAKKDVRKAQEDTAKYKGYYTIFWRFAIGAAIILTLLGVFVYFKYFSALRPIL